MKAVASYQFILCASVAQAHAVKQWNGYSWRSRENCTFFSLLSEFVYMWKTLQWFLRIYCNWDFYYFGAVSSGIVRKTWLFLTQRWLLFLLIVVSWQVFWWFWLYDFSFLSGFSLLFLLLFLNFSLCDQLFCSRRSGRCRACTSSTSIWKQTHRWIKQSWILGQFVLEM